MLVGPGGVVALVIGAWSVLWAIVAVPDRSWHRWLVPAAAFVGAMSGFALLTSTSEVALGLEDWIVSAPEDRALSVATTAAACLRPWASVILGTAGLASTVVVLTRQSPAEPAPGERGTGVWFAVAWFAALLLAGLVDVALLRATFQAATTDVLSALRHLPTVRAYTWLGVLLAGAQLTSATLVAALRLLRRVRLRRVPTT